MSSRFPRNTGSGRVVDTGPPRTSTGLSGLGAVGGPGGVGAGAFRVLVEFLLEYDSDKIKSLEKQLDGLSALEEKSSARLNDALLSRAATDKQLFEIQKSKAVLTKDELSKVREIRDLRLAGGKENRNAANAIRQQLIDETNLTKYQIDQLAQEKQIRLDVAQNRAKQTKIIREEEEKLRDINKQQLVAQKQLVSIQAIKAGVLPKLGSLALGAIGNIFGGALIGIGFAAAQALLDQLAEGFQNLIDPARHAREELKGVADQVDKLAQQKKITTLEASKQLLADLGPIAKDLDPNLLAAAVSLQRFKEQLEELDKLKDIIDHYKELNNELLRTRALAILQDQMSDDVGGFNRLKSDVLMGNPHALNDARYQSALAQAQREVQHSADGADSAVRNLANAEAFAAGQANLAAYAQQQMADAINRISGLRITGLQDQIDALGGPSARTTAIQQQIDAINEAQQQSAAASQLSAIQEQRALILFEQQLATQHKVVDVSKLSAKFQLVAIDARIKALQNAGRAEENQLDLINEKIRALQKQDQAQDKADQAALKVFDDKIAALREEGDEQDRLNQLLDLQYRASQKLERNKGESIGDFIARRAQENRSLLAEEQRLRREDQIGQLQKQRDDLQQIQEVANAEREARIEALQGEAERLQATLDRIHKQNQAAIEALQEEKERIERQVQLDELAQQERQIKDSETTRKHLAELEKRLEASQKADEAETKKRKAELEKQIQAERDAAQQSIKFADLAEQDKVLAAIKAARSSKDIYTIIGELQGATNAKAYLETVFKALGLPDAITAPVINGLKNIITQGNARINSIIRRRFHGVVEGAAQGGVFELNNSMNPFGQNIRVGEQGKELGIVLSNKVHKLLQENSSPKLPPMSFVINRSDDPFRDKDRFGRAVEEAFAKNL